MTPRARTGVRLPSSGPFLVGRRRPRPPGGPAMTPTCGPSCPRPGCPAPVCGSRRPARFSSAVADPVSLVALP
ncbi:hypothetical protein SBRY_30527 [Actinacidiphila bryophytorum]|uniref:Uncharacterized protein n=1 Tax=Actinacidiphila bryophytorum TaxID=1436133 RepID=A0A9W4H165_9ACTN|nr:hypothetical protein SBRY_30527 [Actinacidiphila bryophytorum]